MDEDESFGLIQPTLIQQIKKILDEYPDDGQILKELIQNAEDAGASEMKFLIDHHYYETTNLQYPELKKFQGPALYAYNNAKFTEGDWKGLGMLCDSIKVKDPTKVGRFGLGFKSVFHMTDLPSVVSGKSLGIIDPHEKCFSNESGRTSGMRVKLNDPITCKNEFAPYKNVFDCTQDTFQRGFYDGTLFRLPFRQQTSKLSNTLYSDDEKIQGLFESFKSDAHLVLLFLMNLERIEIYERKPGVQDAEKLFSVALSKDCKASVQAARCSFRAKMDQKTSDDVTQTYVVKIETLDCQSGKSSKYSYAVTHFLNRDKLSSKMEELVKDESLSYMPRVGVAFPLNNVDEVRKPSGHVFCFLPLPLEDKSLTGLPVHVNGFFALSQNRRHLKWRSADQKGTTDKSLDWNEGLLAEVLPKAYAELVFYLIFERMLQDVVYSAWPDVSTVDIKWVIFLKPFFNLLFTARELLYSRVGGGCWCSLKDVRFDNISRHSDTRDSVIKLLNDVGHKIVTVPNHVQLALKMYYSGNFKEITPSLVRKSLKNNSLHYIVLSREKKLFLLKYILSDSKFKQLEGLHLLPLSTKEFTKFNSKCSDVIYIDSPEHPRSLLPGMDAMFLDTDVDDYIKNQLRIAAREGCAQLCHFGKIGLKKHLRKALPADWTSSEVKSSGHVEWYPGHGQHPPRSWLENMWRYLIKHFNGNNDLDEFLGIPLIPLQDTSSTKKRAKNRVKLACIQKPSTLLLSNFHRDQLEKSVLEKVSAFGVTVVESLPEFVISHRSLVPYYINPPRPRGVLTALFMVFRYDPRCMSLDVRALRKLFSQISSPTASEINFLKKLKLFDTCCHPALAVPSRPVTVIEVPKGAPLNDLPPVRWCFEMIDVRDNSSRTLGEMLGIEPMDLAVLVKKMLEDAWSGKYSNKEIDDLVKYTMDHFRVFSRIVSNEIKHLLATIPFVTSYNNTRKKPAELFDPQDNIVTEMFLYEPDKFPKAGCYYSKPFVLHRLKDLGLKAREDVRPQDILSSAKMVNQIGSLQKSVKKSTAILRHLDKNPTLLKAPLLYELYSIPWIPVVSERSESYPCTLKLNVHDGLACPEEVTSVRYQLLVGSINPLVDDTSAADISRNFGWNRAPSIYDVIAHLKNVISSYHEEEKNTYVIVIKEVYRYLAGQNVSDVIVVLNEERIHQWIWNGNGFSSVDEMIETHEVMNLQPYLYPLPMEVREFTSFFNECGMKHEPDSYLLLNVLQRINESHLNCSSKPQNEVRRDLRYCIQILDALKPKDGETLDDEIRARLLVPVDVEEETWLELALIEECTYCDREWLQKGHEVSDVDETDDEKIKFVHRNISNATAEILKVPTLMSRILDADELEMGESFGQSESLLDRLKGLLEGYTDGLSVPKELIQNADDAGATEVRFLYDERTNDNAMTNLIDEGMKECQGPALWTYNNAIFTEEDFQNVVKLNAATKEYNTSKIGRFGLGFNSVYNLTDVPSFVSGNSIVILDPHTEYLGKAIRDRSKPGIRVDSSKKRFDKLQNQFKPYNGIFGCDLSPGNKNKRYNGTLFRFPLRTASQAKKSKIKNLCYDDNQVKELLRILLHGAESLLLFTQNVLSVGVYHLSDEDQDPSQPVELFSISKSCEDVIHRLPCEVSLSNQAQQLKDSEQEFVKQSSILKASTERLKTLILPSSKVLMTSSLVIRSCCTLSERGKDFLQIVDAERNSKAESQWLVHSCMIGGKVLTLSRSIKGISPVAGAAAKLEMKSCGKLIPLTLMQKLEDVTMLVSRSTPNEGGKVFCFLPLPIHSGLPVHINGCFAVDDSRRHLRERTEEDKSDHGAKWNQILMSQVIVQAFLGLLEDVKRKFTDVQYHFHTLWPTISNLKPQWHHFVKSFYKALCSHEKDLELFTDGKTWSSIDNIAFLDPSFKDDDEIGSVAFDVFKAVSPESKVIIDMPGAVFHTFEYYGLGPSLQKCCFDKERFFREVVFPFLELIEEQQRNALVLYALDDQDLQSLVREHRCIPSSLSGNHLKYPKELIHPNGSAARLYEPDDGKFPFGAFSTEGRLLKLKSLGMREDEQEWEEILERAQSVQGQRCYEQSIQRTKFLLEFIGKKLKQNDQSDSCGIRSSLQHTCFLPILQKPQSFPFRWKGNEYQQTTFLSAAELYPKELKYLVSASVPILDDRKVNVCSEVRRFLAISKNVKLNQAKIQLQNVIEVKESEGENVIKEVEKACEKLYEYFQRVLSDKDEAVISFLKPMKFILVGSHFLSASQMAFHGTLIFPPYLSKLPSDWMKFFELFKLLGAHEAFEIGDYVAALAKVKDDYGDKAVDDDVIEKVVSMLHLLCKSMEVKQVLYDDVLDEHGKIFLPDSDRIMKPSADVCVKDCIWMPDEADITYASERIPLKISIALGVKTRRQETFSRFAIGIPFGQKEKLTNRLKRILTGYPCDGSIMKELLQNADDAKATKICFIKDPRHHASEKVFEESWKPLQGPALCVYNDAPFTNRDIEGIQSLGEGSKGDDPNKTGQYGVGFNAVYHLTDVPSFLSKGKEIGEVMCAFDPNFQYVPSATSESPGIKIDKLDVLRKTFTDVWPCYLEHHFPIENGTMFRFPLRNEEMAEKSKISRREVTFERLTSLVNDFQKELLEALLFVNHVKEISIHEVDKDNGSIQMTYQVKSHISEADEKKRQEFSNDVKSIGKQLQSGKISFSEIPVRKVSYILHLEDSHGVRQKWLVVQQIGYECNKDICHEEGVVKAFKQGELGLLPRGGVATLINSSNDKPPGKAFCFLPLPFVTGLPVHINGHFALDHEARRNLWRSETSDYRSKWNEILLKQVVAPCYVLMLEEIRGFINLPVRCNQTVLKGSRKEMECFLENYASLFPSLELKESYWVILAKSVYRHLSMQECHVLPVLRYSSVCRDESQGEGRIEWLPPTGQGEEKVFFDDMKPFKNKADGESIDNKLKEYFVLRDTLLAVGLNLLHMPMAHYDFFVDSEVSVNRISPKELLAFFHSYGGPSVLQHQIGILPLPIKSTPFKSADNLLLVLIYCKKESTFCQDLHGLPLLLTQDNQLRVFDKHNPVYLSGFCDLVPACSELFVHRQLFNRIFYQDRKEMVSYLFKVFDIAEFARLLPSALNEVPYRSPDKYVSWNPVEKDTKIPSKRWIYHVWRFFDSVIRPAVDQYDAQTEEQLRESTKDDHCTKIDFEKSEGKSRTREKKRLILHFLEPVKHWCLLPVTEIYRVQRSHQMQPHPTYLQHKHFLAPLQLAETVLFHSRTTHSLKDSIEWMSLPELNCRIFQGTEYLTPPTSCREIPLMIVSNLDDGRLFLSVLLHKLKVDSSFFQKLRSTICMDVLHYLNDHIQDFQTEDVDDLKSFPFYTTTHGNNISIRNKQAFVLSKRIPSNDMDKWEEKSGIVFLKEYDSLKKLHSFLGCDSKSEVDVYCDIIFENFQDISKEARLEHLKFISTLLGELENPCPFKFNGLDENAKNHLKADLNQNKEKLMQALRNLKFDLSHDGSLKFACNFYDPLVEVFRFMLPEEYFPAQPFCEYNWLTFLRKIGLIHKVTDEMFVRFAEEVASEGQRNPVQRTGEKSEILVSYLFSIENIATSPLLNKVKHIPFILRQKIDEQLEQLHPPFSRSQYVCFQGSMTDYHHAEIVWTSVNILPRYANPRSLQDWSFIRNYGKNSSFNSIGNYKQEIIKKLGILERPTCEMVISHCVKICTSLCRSENTRPENNSNGCSNSNIATHVMTPIYSFLQENYQDNSYVITSGLHRIRCILVEDGNRLIRPQQVVVDLMREDEIPPYLYKIPSRFAPYGDLFVGLGATQTVTVTQYAMVLDCIHKHCKDNNLNPNETNAILKATKGLFLTLSKNCGVDGSSLQSLYLPGTRQNPVSPDLNSVFVRKSSEIFFSDAPHFKDRLRGFQGHILVKFKECGLNVENDDRLVNMMPEPLRPIMLTSEVHEALVGDDQHVAFSNATQDLKNTLTSHEFCCGLIRLMRHANYERDIHTEDDIVSRVQRRLSCINVYSVKNLRTKLTYQGSTIPESEAEVACFEERKKEGNRDVCNIYVEEQKSIKAYLSRVAEIVDRVTGHLLGNQLVHLSMMLQCSLDEISSFLDQLKIREDNSYSKTDPSIFPKPGHFIHIEDHYLLENAFTRFEPGEYVGYELDDPSLRGEDGAPTFIYAIIVERISQQRYKINIGSDTEHIEVNADKLYKFYRRTQDKDEGEIDLFTGKESIEVKPDNLDDAKRQVRKTLENAWQLPEERKRRIIRRLYLSWHPDKNPGNEEFCTEVFKFLQAEIARLENGLSVDDTSWSRYGTSAYGGYYSDLFRNWSGFAESHRRHRSSYESRGGGQPFHRKNPQPGEAKRWYRQARADLQAASKDIHYDKPSYEWACFKCHQSAEKALKAAQYSQDADHSWTHDLPEIANSVGDSELQRLACSLEGLLGNSTRMRYPDRVYSYPKIPHDIYSKEEAEEALATAQQILVIVQNKFVQ